MGSNIRRSTVRPYKAQARGWQRATSRASRCSARRQRLTTARTSPRSAGASDRFPQFGNESPRPATLPVADSPLHVLDRGWWLRRRVTMIWWRARVESVAAAVESIAGCPARGCWDRIDASGRLFAQSRARPPRIRANQPGADRRAERRTSLSTRSPAVRTSGEAHSTAAGYSGAR